MRDQHSNSQVIVDSRLNAENSVQSEFSVDGEIAATIKNMHINPTILKTSDERDRHCPEALNWTHADSRANQDGIQSAADQI
jgi:hypothetical protein